MSKALDFLLCALASLLFLAWDQPSIAATITPVQPGASTSYIPSVGPVACGAGVCTTTLNPLGVGYLQPNSFLGGLQTTLNAEFAGKYTLATGPNIGLGTPVNPVTLNVQYYQAINTGTVAGGNFVMSVNGLNANNTPAGTLHWLQWVTDNYNITGDNGAVVGTAPMGPGNPEDTIDGAHTSPFYDVTANALPPPNNFNTTPPANPFQDGSRRPEPTAANPVINWDAWLFLVTDQPGLGAGGTDLITFYDGVNWGWTATFSATPLPPAWTMMLTALGILGFAVRRRPVALAA